jgi:vacuolar protein sorting-associated protein 35
MEDEQAKHLEEAASVVKQEAFEMLRALDSSDLKEALKHATTMIGELKTSLLSPTSYYELYLKIFDQLSFLKSHFLQEVTKGSLDIADLYEKVQHASSVVPRLYLLITVGSVYIPTRKLPANEILKDLLEMVKGVQHPIRGLFLRYYLNQCCNQLLPDDDNNYDGTGGDVSDSLDFLLTNLGEMNRLWVRMQHTGGIREKSKRERERNDIRVTVGSNIIRLSNLVGVSIESYETVVLPRLLEISVGCKDAIAQQYIMDCIIQAFPDDYHLKTLKLFLESCTQLQAGVDVRSIIIIMLDRMSRYAGEAQTQGEEFDIFTLFKTYIDKILQEHATTMETRKLLEMQVTFLKFSLKFYPQSLENVNMILDSCSSLVEKTKDQGLDSDSHKQIVKLLSFPMETISLAILNMSHYPKLMSHLEYTSKIQVAYKIVQAVINSRHPLNSLDMANKLLEFINPILVDPKEQIDMDKIDLEDEMQNVARLVHLVVCEHPEEYFEVLNHFKVRFAAGGPRRYKYTFPALIYAYIRLLKYSVQFETALTPEKIFKTQLEVLTKFSEGNSLQALKLYLQCAHAASNVDPGHAYEDLSYDFISQALIIYEEELAESDVLFNTINLITATLMHLHNFDEDNSDTLITKAAKHAARQLKKPDQCIAVLNVTHLFWNDRVREENRIVECLKRALKIAELSMSSPKNVGLYVSILNKYLYYILQGVEGIEPERISELIELISDHMTQIQSEKESPVDISPEVTYLRNTIAHIRAKRSSGFYQGINT